MYKLRNNFQTPAKDCEKRWDTLRTYYSREKKRLSIPTGSGSVPRKKTFQLFDQMTFLSDFVKTRKYENNNSRTQSSQLKVSYISVLIRIWTIQKNRLLPKVHGTRTKLNQKRMISQVIKIYLIFSDTFF